MKRMSPARAIAYGLPGLATLFTFTMFTTYGLYFFTNIVGLSGKFAGLIMTIGTLWDAVTDPLVGIISDNRDPRKGRRRPFLLVCAIPFGIVTWLLFTAWDFVEIQQKIYFIIVALLFYTFQTLIDVPYTSLSGEVTDNYDLRSKLATIRTFWAIIGVAIGGGIMAYTDFLEPVVGGSRQAWSVCFAFFGIICTLSIWIGYKASEGYENKDIITKKSYSIKEMLEGPLRNKPFLHLTIAFIFAILAQAIFLGVLVYYLRYNLNLNDTQVSLVSVDKDSKTITLKGKAPSIEKEADKTTVEIGQVVTYTITGTIPDTTGYAQYTYKIHDTLTEGLDFVEDTMGKLPTEKKYEVSVQIEGEQDSVIKEADIDPDNARKMTLDLSQWIRENQTHKGKTFTVTYYAKVNADAVVQTNNSAHLEYGNDPDNITTTTPDVVTTPTYPVQIHKLIKDQQNSYLAGAIFRLYRSEEDANNNQNAIAVTGSNGTYTVDPVQVGDNKMYDMESIGDGTTVGTGMNLKLNGLAEGSYWLVETQAPDGYNKLTAPVKITITKSDTTNVNDWTIKQNDGVVDDKIIDIENTTGTLLPETGGMGTVIFTVIAVVMILGIAVSFVISRRKRA